MIGHSKLSQRNACTLSDHMHASGGGLTASRLALTSLLSACSRALPSMMSAWPPWRRGTLRDAAQGVSQLLLHRCTRQRLRLLHAPGVLQRADLLPGQGALNHSLFLITRHEEQLKAVCIKTPHPECCSVQSATLK